MRCSWGETLAVEQMLVLEGFQVWTPARWEVKRLPRRRAKVAKMVPVMPSYLFVREDEVERIAASRKWEVHQAYAPMVIAGEYVVVEDWELDGLREFDKREPPGKKAHDQPNPLPDPVQYKPGDHVRLLGAFQGFEGVVEEIRPNGDVGVAIKNSPSKVVVTGYMLRRNSVYGGKSEAS